MKEMFDQDGVLKIRPYKFYKNMSRNEIRLMCHRHGLYGVPTTELIDFLKKQIGDKKALEIGAGNGAIGKALGIPSTDSYLQDVPEVKAFYLSLGQPTVKYGHHVEKLSAKDAIRKYKPDIVIGSWITHKYSYSKPDLGGNIYGVTEEDIIKKSTYIMIGNKTVHASKPILTHNHQELQMPFVVSRASIPEDNVIYIWNKK